MDRSRPHKSAAEKVDDSTAAMVWAMARAGLRVGEAIALQRRDVEGNTLHVRRSVGRDGSVRPVKGRNRQGRSIPVPADLAARLARHITSQTLLSMEGWLFTAPSGGQLRYDNWRTRVWAEIVETAGIGDVRPHDLRHSVATRLCVADGCCAWSGVHGGRCAAKEESTASGVRHQLPCPAECGQREAFLL